MPTILQYDETPLIQVVRAAEAGFTTEIPVYHSDGTYLAKVVGSQIYRTADGEKAGVTLRHPGHATVCEMNGKTLFELVREDAAALKNASRALHTRWIVHQVRRCRLDWLCPASRARASSDPWTQHDRLHVPRNQDWRLGEKRWKRRRRGCMTRASSRAIEPTASRRTIQFSVSRTRQSATMRGPARSGSSCSR